MTGRVLIIAGSDSGGGAGIQADIKSVTMLGGYASTAITALTAQNTLGVQAVLSVDPGFIRAQMLSVLDDIGADVIKTGMLHDAVTIETVLKTIDEIGWAGTLVVDPVMVATSGDPLLQESALEQLKILIGRADVVTPNIPEAQLLTGANISGEADMEQAAVALQHIGAKNVILKGGHLEGDAVADLLLSADQKQWVRNAKLQTRHTHGTGCTLASAVAAFIANGETVETAFTGACQFVKEAIKHAPELGVGHGPLGHMHVKSL
ncbi:bifunctional hydroxymethylpyrimidine kinase/phosphomethylpyrimidine kinase [Kordiimonas sp. SCSIO 12610]|uniref:bifunctional hydroxymethylpyrimidine kinase/phosphomethylpyrimidine kinase n=1 Tax=Kordiimonas sp. SCSIO 12610 TaxID=2829597 RepID=UPI00210DD75D|nr:bifunctional hydroxymethylpyrimidine kinase/phosphomethylpyrimidine kinase [Kordiimonas sp. SCSIO 12610]UTW56456.1 bifunctional hydroxymethylpyrimidine kinase/phosphomethylpyrimidine kinase [Kordiimonas sp. SCSIO 12610]